MAKMTVLEMVQKIMSRMDSDEVDTYDESIESVQVAEILEDSYFEILARRSWEFLKHRIRTLDAGTNVAELTLPTDVMHIELLRYWNYNTGRMDEVRYVPPREFLDKAQRLDTSLSNIEGVVINDGVTIGVYRDRTPTEWTSFDEETIVFNAYDAANDTSGIDATRSTMLAEVLPVWTVSDTFTPDLPARMFPLLLNEALSVASLDIKQEANQKAEQNARRQYIRLKQLERRVVQDNEVADYGRKPSVHRTRINPRG
jgi:hypothetical protein